MGGVREAEDEDEDEDEDVVVGSRLSLKGKKGAIYLRARVYVPWPCQGTAG